MKDNIEVKYHNYTFLTDEEMGERLKRGRYESEEIGLLKHIPNINKFSVLELGGCLEVVSVILNKKLDDPQKHVVIEANPRLISYLEYNKKINDCSFLIKNAMITNDKDNNIFYSYDKLVAGSAHRMDNWEANKTEHIIDTISLEDLRDQVNHDFDLLVMDIEGGELDFFKNYLHTYKFKYILFEVHGFPMMYKGFDKECRSILDENGYKIVKHKGGSSLLVNEYYK